MAKELDVLIIGGGPAGMTAGLYASRSGLRVAIAEKIATGGQMGITAFVENYPGFFPGINGYELAQKMEDHARHFGTEFINGEIKKIHRQDTQFVVEMQSEEIYAKAVILATGATPKTLGVPGETEFRGHGVSYCATCDGAFYRGKRVAVIGGGDSAVDEALYLTRFAESVTIVHRRNQLRAIQVLQDRAFANPQIHFQWDSVLEGIEGDQKVEKIRVRNVKTDEITEIPVDGVFFYVGLLPNTQFVPDDLLMENGYVITDEDMATNIPGFFAAGDVRKKSLRQVVTAAADGAIAVHSVEKYLESL